MLNILTKTTIMASLGLLVCAPAAQAADTTATNSANINSENTDWKGDAKGPIDALPKSGTVNVQGKVESVDNDKKRFVISDNTGDTIDVHTDKPIELKEGDSVKVNGKVQSEVAGVGKEIISASVQINK